MIPRNEDTEAGESDSAEPSTYHLGQLTLSVIREGGEAHSRHKTRGRQNASQSFPYQIATRKSRENPEKIRMPTDFLCPCLQALSDGNSGRKYYVRNKMKSVFQQVP